MQNSLNAEDYKQFARSRAKSSCKIRDVRDVRGGWHTRP
jgi:hypothetical protein